MIGHRLRKRRRTEISKDQEMGSSTGRLRISRGALQGGDMPFGLRGQNRPVRTGSLLSVAVAGSAFTLPILLAGRRASNRPRSPIARGVPTALCSPSRSTLTI